MRSPHLLLGVLFVSTTACGGNVVFVGDGDGSGGGGTSSTDSVTTTVTTSTITTGSSCDVLQADYEDALRAAQSCDPTIDSIQCDGSAILNDTCGCPTYVANERTPDLYQAALSAYDAWVSAGCGPLGCGQACFPAQGGFCQAGPEGGGTCAAFGPD